MSEKGDNALLGVLAFSTLRWDSREGEVRANPTKKLFARGGREKINKRGEGGSAKKSGVWDRLATGGVRARGV